MLPSTRSSPSLPEDLFGQPLNLQEMQSLGYFTPFIYFRETKKPILF
jgi:hypothetical protein